jgi:hypothetical protein
MALIATLLIVVQACGGDRASAAKKKKKPGISLKQQTFQTALVDKGERFTINCPKGKFPLGGGMFNDTRSAPTERRLSPLL